MPPETVYVGRPTKWGNKFKPADGDLSIDECLMHYRADIERMERMGEVDLMELRGKNLACWCKENQPCHADVLLELANK